MYSYEDRIRAVELYIKLGKRVRPTIRQLGYPTKNSLMGWYNEYQRKLDLPKGYAGRDAAIETVTETSDRPVVHSDRGGHYRWPGWLSRMSDANLTRSMSRKACSPDNAACEGFFGRLKNELFYPRDWNGTTIDQFIEAVDSYIRWYNEKRIKISLGSLSPIEYRASLGLAA